MTGESEAKAAPYAWYALGVLVLVYMLNFIDRQILSILANDIKADLEMTDADLGFLYGTAFAIFYALFGIPLGLLIARFRAAEDYVDPYLSILLVTPMAALIPLLVMSLGIGLASRVIGPSLRFGAPRSRGLHALCNSDAGAQQACVPLEIRSGSRSRARGPRAMSAASKSAGGTTRPAPRARSRAWASCCQMPCQVVRASSRVSASSAVPWPCTNMSDERVSYCSRSASAIPTCCSTWRTNAC